MSANLQSLLVTLLVIWGWGSSVSVAAESRVEKPMYRAAMISPLADHSMLLGVTWSGQRLVAVGERGIVLFSDDQGGRWNQASVPVSVTLTVVKFSDDGLGWAAGHNGVVLQTSDQGMTWERVIDGLDVIALYQEEAVRLSSLYGEEDVRAKRAHRQAALLEQDGPDKPWLDMTIDAAGKVWLVGAYGLAVCGPNGRDWKVCSSGMDNRKEMHLYAIRIQDHEVVVAGEQGLLRRSVDNGQTFQRIELPYDGSFFTLELEDSEIVVAGLGGNTFRSTDHGETFDKVAMPTPVTITASLPLKRGSFLLADKSGSIYLLDKNQVSRIETTPVPDSSAMVETSTGALVVVGRFGPRLVESLMHNE